MNGEGARAVAVAANDTIVLVGSGPTGNFTVWRLTDSGNADPAFGSGGRAVIGVPNVTPAVAGALSGTSIVAAGGSGGDFAIAQVTENGTAAPGFGPDGGGVAIAKPGSDDDMARAVAVLADGRIVVGGTKSVQNLRSPVFAVARLATNGAVDATFGTGGVVSFDFEGGGVWKNVDETLQGLVVDSRGRVVVAGYVFEQPQMGPGFNRTVLARLKEDGSLDPLFGTGGRVSFTDPQNRLRGSALARAANGALIVAGTIEGDNQIFVARIIP